MTPKDVFDHYGSISETAKKLGVRYATVWHWQKTGKVPPSRQYEIEVRTGGLLQADRSAA